MEKTLTIAPLLTDDFWTGRCSLVAASGSGDAPPVASLPEGGVAFSTSGTTGEPSWLVISKRALQVSAAAVNRYLGVGSSNRWGLVLPLHHVGGFGVVARAFEAGCGLAAFPGKWNPCGFGEWLEREGVTHTSLVPTQVHDLVAAGLRSPSSLRAVVVGGGGLAAGPGAAARRLGWPVLASYGMTETASQVATQGVEALRSEYVPAPLPPLPIWQVGVEESGCLRVAGPALFSGWLRRDPAAWRYRERAGEWFTTRDLVTILPGGGLWIDGRADELVKVLGELVSPARVEAMVRDAGPLATATGFAVVAVPDARMGHRLVAVAESPGDLDRVRGALDRHNAVCPGHLRLSAPVLVPDIPRSALGKVRRAALAHLLATASAPGEGQ